MVSVVGVVCLQVEVSATGFHSSRAVLPSMVCLSVIAKFGQGPTRGLSRCENKNERKNVFVLPVSVSAFCRTR